MLWSSAEWKPQTDPLTDALQQLKRNYWGCSKEEVYFLSKCVNSEAHLSRLRATLEDYGNKV